MMPEEIASPTEVAPPKLCECGCGHAAPIAIRNCAKYRKGEPKRFIIGHHSRVMERQPFTEKARAKMSASQRKRFEDPAEAERHSKINVGRKHSAETRRKVSSSLKGRTFSRDHLERLAAAGSARSHPVGRESYRWKGADASYTAIHQWLVKHYPKTGVCEACGRDVGAEGQAGTHYAFQHHGTRDYTRDRSDYCELCPACHNALDKGGNYRAGAELRCTA